MTFQANFKIGKKKKKIKNPKSYKQQRIRNTLCKRAKMLTSIQ